MVQTGLFTVIGAGLIMLVSNASADSNWATLHNKNGTFYCSNYMNAVERTKQCCHALELGEVWYMDDITYCYVPDPAYPKVELDLFALKCCGNEDGA